MELQQFARQILLTPELGQKLKRPELPFTDLEPGEAVRVETPARSADLQFASPRTAPSMPKPGGFAQQERKATAHHIMANHELQALEVMAMVLLAFPEAPQDFRMGLAEIMMDEQRHTRLHAERASELGIEFGQLPVNSYIWTKAAEYSSTLEYVAGLPLVFEGANLDHTVELQQLFLKHGDQKGANIMKAIHLDEIRHVQFGYEWLKRLKDPGMDDFDAWLKALHWPVRPLLAVGSDIQVEARRAAGMEEDFLQKLLDWQDTDAIEC